jgi:hypothetical protein
LGGKATVFLSLLRIELILPRLRGQLLQHAEIEIALAALAGGIERGRIVGGADSDVTRRSARLQVLRTAALHHLRGGTTRAALTATTSAAALAGTSTHAHRHTATQALRAGAARAAERRRAEHPAARAAAAIGLSERHAGNYP